MKIAIIGYGKMGHRIEAIARERGHEIVSVIDVDNRADIDGDAFKSADVAIEFSVPASAPKNVEDALTRGVSVVSGTTGWSDKLPEMKALSEKVGKALIWSSNYSVGVNLFRLVNKYLARLMEKFPQYSPQLRETHHIHKLDHPSGTAITLAEDLIASAPRIGKWKEVEEESAMESVSPDTIPVMAFREGEVPGIHSIRWDSPVDYIEITHSAKSRDGFALGAVMAAEWLAGKSGFFTMDEMMSELTGL